jgi:hypothetical protein
LSAERKAVPGRVEPDPVEPLLNDETPQPPVDDDLEDLG